MLALLCLNTKCIVYLLSCKGPLYQCKIQYEVAEAVMSANEENKLMKIFSWCIRKMRDLDFEIVDCFPHPPAVETCDSQRFLRNKKYPAGNHCYLMMKLYLLLLTFWEARWKLFQELHPSTANKMGCVDRKFDLVEKWISTIQGMNVSYHVVLKLGYSCTYKNLS